MRGHAGVVDILQQADEIDLSTVVLGELLAGFRRGERWHRNLEALRRFQASPRVRRVAPGEQTAHRYAEILTSLRQAGTPIPTNDVWIAASALEQEARVLTTDQHFRRVRQVSSIVLEP